MIEKLLNLRQRLAGTNSSIDHPDFFLQYAVNDVIENTKHGYADDYAAYADRMILESLASTDTTVYTKEYALGYTKVLEMLTA